jgi:ferrous-iron efflux pump FieF
MTNNLDTTNKKDRLLVMATYASVTVAVCLIVVKVFAALYTGSASILGSLIDSMMDSMASVVTLFAVRYSLKPADEDHRFGHGKAESIAAVAQAGFIIASGGFLLFYCAERLLGQQVFEVQHTTMGVVIISVSILLTVALVLFQSYVIKLTNSEAIRADRLHYKSDILMNGSVMVALICAAVGWSTIDIILAICIAFYIMYGAVDIGMQGLQTLMDQELPAEVDAAITEAAMSHEHVRGVHDLRTRKAGTQYIIQMHVEMDDETLLLDAHAIADDVEQRIRVLFPQADIIIHQDPVSVAALEPRVI